MSGRSWRLLDILENTSRFFASKGLENARLQAELLLAAVLGVKRLDLYLQFERPLHSSEVDRYREYVRQRLQARARAVHYGRGRLSSSRVDRDACGVDPAP